MATVVDAARVTTPGKSVWRTCAGCGTLAPLAPTADRCPICARPDSSSTAEHHTVAGWEFAQRYAGILGRIEAWALLIPDVTDAERLDHIRKALIALDQDMKGVA